MCDPTGITPSLIMMAVSAAMTAASQYQQQKSANKQAEFRARVADQNAKTKRKLANYAIEKGRLEEQRQRVKTARLKGTQRAGYALAGVEMDTGSPLDMLEDTAALGEIDALNVRHGAALDAWQHEVGASDALTQSTLYRSSKASPLTQSLPTLLSGASSVASKWPQ